MPWAFRQRIAIRKRKLTTTRSTLMRHSLSYLGRLRSSNAEVAFVRANFTAGRGHAWEGGRAPRSGIEAMRATPFSTVRSSYSHSEIGGSDLSGCLIPTPVKVEVWRRDRGQCVQCGSTKNLHFDHNIPSSKGC
jgi:hypothetical protein